MKRVEINKVTCEGCACLSEAKTCNADMMELGACCVPTGDGTFKSYIFVEETTADEISPGQDHD